MKYCIQPSVAHQMFNPGSLVAQPLNTLKHLVHSHYKLHTHSIRTHTHTQTHDNGNLLPAQHTQNEIENEKGAEDDERDKIDPRQLIAHSILHLREREKRKGKERG